MYQTHQLSVLETWFAHETVNDEILGSQCDLVRKQQSRECFAVSVKTAVLLSTDQTSARTDSTPKSRLVKSDSHSPRSFFQKAAPFRHDKDIMRRFSRMRAAARHGIRFIKQREAFDCVPCVFHGLLGFCRFVLGHQRPPVPVQRSARQLCL